MTKFSMFAPSGFNTGEQLARRNFFEGLHNFMKNKRDGNESKIILEDFNCIMDKMDKDGGNKTQRLCINMVLIMSCQNLSCKMGSRIYGEGKNQIPLGSPTTSNPLAQDPG